MFVLIVYRLFLSFCLIDCTFNNVSPNISISLFRRSPVTQKCSNFSPNLIQRVVVLYCLSYNYLLPCRRTFPDQQTYTFALEHFQRALTRIIRYEHSVFVLIIYLYFRSNTLMDYVCCKVYPNYEFSIIFFFFCIICFCLVSTKTIIFHSSREIHFGLFAISVLAA